MTNDEVARKAQDNSRDGEAIGLIALHQTQNHLFVGQSLQEYFDREQSGSAQRAAAGQGHQQGRGRPPVG